MPVRIPARSQTTRTASRRSRYGGWAVAAASALLLLPALPAAANAADRAAGPVTIDFDDLPTGTPNGDEQVNTQYPEATFSSTGDGTYVVTASELTNSKPNFICAMGDNTEIWCNGETTVSFASPVNQLSFSSIAVVSEWESAEVDVFENGVLSATVPIVGGVDGHAPPPVRQDLSAFHDVTKIVLRTLDAETNAGWDDFTFVPADEEEEPPAPCAAPGPDEVVVYEDANFAGRCVLKGLGQYDSDAAFAPLPDNSASSVRVGENVTAVLASDRTQGGDKEQFTSDDADFGDNGPVPGEELIGDDRMSSFAVQRRDDVVTARLNVFIPNSAPGATPVPGGPYMGSVMVPGPFGPLNDCFLTDQREFSFAKNASSRVHLDFEVDMRTKDLVFKGWSDPTTEVDCEDGAQECKKVGVPRADRLRKTVVGNTVMVDFAIAQGNPCWRGAARVNVKGALTLVKTSTGAVEVQFAGLVEEMPNYEMYVDRGVNTREIFRRQYTGTFNSLIGPANIAVGGQATLP